VATYTIFLATALLTIPAVVALSYVRSDEIDYARARNARKGEVKPDARNIVTLFKNSALLWFAGCLALFRLADSSLFPLASENVASALDLRVPLSSPA
jgi:hypothetical protein